MLFSCLGSKVTVYSRKLQWFFASSCEFKVHRAGSQLKSSATLSKVKTHVNPREQIWETICTFIRVNLEHIYDRQI